VRIVEPSPKSVSRSRSRACGPSVTPCHLIGTTSQNAVCYHAQFLDELQLRINNDEARCNLSQSITFAEHMQLCAHCRTVAGIQISYCATGNRVTNVQSLGGLEHGAVAEINSFETTDQARSHSLHIPAPTTQCLQSRPIVASRVCWSSSSLKHATSIASSYTIF
jgi:hypothetical protein